MPARRQHRDAGPSAAATSSMFDAGMAVEAVTASTPATWAAVVADVDGDAGGPQPVEHGQLAEVAAGHRRGPSRPGSGRWRSCPGRRRPRRGSGPGRARSSGACGPLTRPRHLFDEAAPAGRCGGSRRPPGRRRPWPGSAAGSAWSRSISRAQPGRRSVATRGAARRRRRRRGYGRCRSGGPRRRPARARGSRAHRWRPARPRCWPRRAPATRSAAAYACGMRSS